VEFTTTPQKERRFRLHQHIDEKWPFEVFYFSFGINNDSEMRHVTFQAEKYIAIFDFPGWKNLLRPTVATASLSQDLFDHLLYF
jgi:hypothetical protein